MAETQKQEELIELGEKYMTVPTTVSAWTKFRSYIWDADTHLKSPEERRFLLKLDIAVLSTLCLGWFMKYLDQANLANAYVSGMEEDLNFVGNDYTWVVVCYTICYALGQIPSTIIVSKVRPTYWLFGCEIGWGVFTFAQAGAQSVTHMYVFRVMVALFESAFFPCGLLLLGAWYTPVELSKRTAIFHMTAAVGTSFGGYLQVAVYNNLNGSAGLEGWRWLYIVCGCMTVPCSLLCLFVLPDYPHNTRAFYLNEADVAIGESAARSPRQPNLMLISSFTSIANARSARNKKKDIKGAFTFGTFLRAFKRWEFWAFIAAYILYGQSLQAASYYGIWLKFEGFSVADRNLLPTITSYIQIGKLIFLQRRVAGVRADRFDPITVCIFAWGFSSDLISAKKGWRTGRWLMCFAPLLIANIPLGILSIAPSSTKLMQAAFNLSSVWTITAVMYSWANESFAADPEVRALTIGFMNACQYGANAILTATVWEQTKGPRWLAGMSSAWAFAIVGAVVVTGIWYLQMRQYHREKANGFRGGDDTVEAQPLEDDLVLGHGHTKHDLEVDEDDKAASYVVPR